MNETALTITTPQKAKEADTIAHLVDLTKTTEEQGVKLVEALLASPVVSMVAASAIIEALQGVMIFKGRYGWQSQAGTHAQYYGKIYEPLLSQELASGLQIAIISSEAIKSLGGLGGIGKLASLFIR